MDTNSKQPQFNPDALAEDYFLPLAVVGDARYPKHYLMPGTIFVSREPHVVTTILGSGIAVCLWDTRTGVGGINHFTQPDGTDPSNTKYAQAANEELFRRMLLHGVSPHSMTACIFGGSYPPVVFGNTESCLGARNSDAAVRFLHHQNISIRTRETGGVKGRRLVFQTSDGKAWAQQL